MNRKTMLTVIIPAFAACAYLLGAILAKNRTLKKTFSAMSGLMAGQLITEIVLYITSKEEAEEE